MSSKMRWVSMVLIFTLTLLNAGLYYVEAKTSPKIQEVTELSENEEREDGIIIPVLMYHNLTEDYPEGTDGANISPKLFEEHMKGILERGYTPIFVSDYYNSVQRGQELPENPIIITFDDGYLSNYELVFPIIKELKIPITIFIVTSTVGESPSGGKVSYPHFTWAQAREMQESGFVDIQSHSHTHKDMTTLSQAKLQEDLRLSRYLIEKNLNKNCYVFSYPFGRYNKQTSSLARLAGYRMQILVNDAERKEDYLANNTSSGLEHFTRLTVGGKMSVADLFEMIENAVENTKNMESLANN